MGAQGGYDGRTMPVTHKPIKSDFLPKVKVEPYRFELYHSAHHTYAKEQPDMNFSSWIRIALDAQAKRDLAQTKRRKTLAAKSAKPSEDLF